MIIFILNVLAASFIFSSVMYGIITWVGRSFIHIETKKQKYSALMFGFHSAASLKKHMLPRYLAPALFFMWLRSVSFILLLVLSLMEYFFREI